MRGDLALRATARSLVLSSRPFITIARAVVGFFPLHNRGIARLYLCGCAGIPTLGGHDAATLTLSTISCWRFGVNNEIENDFSVCGVENKVERKPKHFAR